MATTKDFDCIAFKLAAQEKIYEQIQGMTPAEEIVWFRQKVECGQFGELWKRIAVGARQPDVHRCAEDKVEYGGNSVFASGKEKK
jgi:hypothetical protein